ncbi:MAG TPA: hypothetical protein VIH18_31550 [Candidatus Binatia bacterium]|jgi:hypothetical protein
MMRRLFLTSIVMGALLFLMPLFAQSDQDGIVRFATLPQSSPGHPEGIAADERRNIYVATFNFAAQNCCSIYL